jgi:hypothetical protein
MSIFTILHRPGSATDCATSGRLHDGGMWLPVRNTRSIKHLQGMLCDGTTPEGNGGTAVTAASAGHELLRFLLGAARDPGSRHRNLLKTWLKASQAAPVAIRKGMDASGDATLSDASGRNLEFGWKRLQREWAQALYKSAFRGWNSKDWDALDLEFARFRFQN